MSHYSQFTSKLSDIDAVKDACAELKLTIKENAYVRYYSSHGQVKADYVISIPGCNYDVGLVRDAKTEISISCMTNGKVMLRKL